MVNNMTTYYEHTPVMLQECIEHLITDPNGSYIDATLGGGGHTLAILEKLGPQARVFGVDQDQQAIDAASQRIGEDSRCTILTGNFGYLSTLLPPPFKGQVAGILLDLGVSTHQLKEADRGFSFNKDGALDMRMDQSQKMTAAIWLRESSEKEIADALYQFGEEKRSRIIASTIKEYQKTKNLDSTLELADLIKSVVKPSKNKHPATRTFQAIRIAINDELKMLSQTLDQTINALKKDGRLVVITFHSIEDRIVKQFIHKHSRPKQLPKGLPIISNNSHHLSFKDLGKVKPSSEEIKINRRARSAILRIVEKC